MEIITGILVGIVIGTVLTYVALKREKLNQVIKDYETQIRLLNDQHQEEIKEIKDKSLSGSRAVIKGKIAEQLAPLLPDFNYLPSDAKFIGDPIDYIVFNGYTELRDGGGDTSNLEIVLLDVKTGKASLSSFQKAIADAVHHGKVRFEVVRPKINKTESGQEMSGRPESESPNTFDSMRDDELFRELRKLRKRFADKRGIPPYMICHDSALWEMCKVRPTNAEELLNISKIGEKFVNNYGDEFLSLIRSYLKH